MSDRSVTYVGSVLFSPFLFGPYKRKKRASARFFKSECVFVLILPIHYINLY
mgnify:CR=1 FL=1|jgi:hypothetical protein